MNFKRKRSKRSVRCTLCTRDRWKGNAKDRRPAKEKGLSIAQRKDLNDVNYYGRAGMTGKRPL